MVTTPKETVCSFFISTQEIDKSKEFLFNTIFIHIIILK